MYNFRAPVISPNDCWLHVRKGSAQLICTQAWRFRRHAPRKANSERFEHTQVGIDCQKVTPTTELPNIDSVCSVQTDQQACRNVPRLCADRIGRYTEVVDEDIAFAGRNLEHIDELENAIRRIDLRPARVDDVGDKSDFIELRG